MYIIYVYNIIFVHLVKECFSSVSIVFTPNIRRIIIRPGSSFEFTCYASNGVLSGILWYINDTQHINFNTTLNAIVNYNSQFSLGSITFHQIDRSLNDTRIKCVANFTSGIVLHSEEHQMIVQGLSNMSKLAK